MGPDGLAARIESDDGIARLVIVDGQRVIRERTLARADTLNWGYEGCATVYLAWHGRRIVAVSLENSFYWLWSLGPDGEEEGMYLPGGWRIAGDLVAFSGDYPGLVFLVELPYLRWLPPLPLSGLPRLYVPVSSMDDRFLTVESDRLALPNFGQRKRCESLPDLPQMVEERLGTRAASLPGRLVIETAMHPYLHTGRERRGPPPVWLALYWYRYLSEQGRNQEAAELLAALENLAECLPSTERECGWRPEWDARQGQVELAARYACRHARTLVAACREGALPPRWYCLLFEPAPGSDQAGSRVNVALFSPFVQSLFAELANSRPKQFAVRW